MMDKRRLIHTVFLVVLPIVVAAYGLSTLSALLLVVLLLAWRWAITLSGIWMPEKTPPVVLDTILASHFAEKARWCLDRLGVDYAENPSGGVLGVLFSGRTVPRLRFRSGLVQSSIGNSAEILRFLWGRYAAEQGQRAAFLEPTAERLALEKRLDRYGIDLQVWVYYHLLPDRELTLRAWGVTSPLIPWWQKTLLRTLYPMLALFIRRSFRINDRHNEKAVLRIEEVLSDIDMRLADGRASILGGEETDFIDITYAGLSGLWLQPANYGGGKAESCRIDRERMPPAMRADVERWQEDFPKASAFIDKMYAFERIHGTTAAEAGQSEEPDSTAVIGAEQ